MSAYEDTCKLNDKLVELVKNYKTHASPAILSDIVQLLLPITRQEASSICSKLGMPYDLIDDMVQESFFKLYATLHHPGNWDVDVCPVFVAFWRTAVRRFFLSTYYKQQQFTKPLEDSQDRKPNVANTVDSSMDLETIRRTLEEEILSWKENADQIPLALDLLHFRILALPDEVQSQIDLARKHGNVTQAYISQWETFLRKEIYFRFNDKMH